MLRKEKLISTKGVAYTSIGCQSNASKSSRNKAPKVRHPHKSKTIYAYSSFFSLKFTRGYFIAKKLLIFTLYFLRKEPIE